MLSSIIESRSRDCRPVIAISNFAPPQILRIVGQRAFDRLVGFGAEIVKFEGESLRN